MTEPDLGAAPRFGPSFSSALVSGGVPMAAPGAGRVVRTPAALLPAAPRPTP